MSIYFWAVYRSAPGAYPPEWFIALLQEHILVIGLSLYSMSISSRAIYRSVLRAYFSKRFIALL
jgi:hypothetical protein